ncbi:N-acetylmuramidase [Pseudalgibacter alginicilyticus]|uniref:Peptidoglycan hydrolase n=1 Tax=Pseudalgibacter alginicilyticus TaxID=1736674 RepID=A0A0P0D598_9FLAO|nr:glucosaminidase domain-containing protein [Pseudalgibacter alginicilyticus]ALJ06101.1 N-acetylmuramidase [Pseudalgibacter alginicilyticus]
MNKIVVIFFVGILIFSCGSKKRVVHKRQDNRTNTEQKDNMNTPTNVPKVTTKTYANATEKYIDTFKEIAQEEMRLYNIPASITLAQGILESGSGNGRLSVEANNHFGIKCHNWTGDKIYHDDDEKGECFRKYHDAKYSYRDHSLFLTMRSRYSKLFTLKKGDYKGWAKELRAAGYATDKKYPQKLISLIERYNLHEYDKEVLGHETYHKEVEHNHVNGDENQMANNEEHVVSKGDTLYSISRKYNLTVEELQNMNGLRNTNIGIGQVLKVK